MQSSTDDSVHSSSSSSRNETDEELLHGFDGKAVSTASAPFSLQTSASTVSSSSSMSCSSTAASTLSHNPHLYRKGAIKCSAASGSADDESGFSSMSSFQDVGLPVPMHSTAGAVQPPQLPPRSRLSTASILSTNHTPHNSTDDDSVSLSARSCNAVHVRHAAATNGGPPPVRPLSINHRRWSSTPAPPVPPKRNLSTFNGDAAGEPLKVLWV